MPSSSFQLIKEAIEKKLQIHADYNGYRREMSPHVLGYKNNQEEHGLFVQFGGFTSSGIITPATREWRCMKVENLRNIQIVEGTFYDGEDKHRKDPKCIDQIITVVKK